MSSISSFQTLISEAKIKTRIQELGSEISAYYESQSAKEIVVVGVLKGSFIFMADLVRSLSIDCEIDFVECASYGDQTISSGKVKLIRDLQTKIRDRDILIVEDIVDTGHTLHFLLELLKERGPKSLSLCAFLDKPSRRVQSIKADFVGFEIDDHFVVGYGLDYNNRFREKKEVLIYEPGE